MLGARFFSARYWAARFFSATGGAPAEAPGYARTSDRSLGGATLATRAASATLTDTARGSGVVSDRQA